jgi:hypothetical protein
VYQFTFPIACFEKTLHDFVQRLWKLRLQEFMAGLAAGFFFPPSVKLFRSAAPIQNFTLEIAHDQGVMRQVEELGLLAIVGFADAKVDFDFAPFEDFLFQRRVGLDPLAVIGKVKRLRHQLREQQGGRHRRRGGDRLDDPRQPVVPVPQVPYLHQVGRTAGHDKQAEQPEHPAEGKVSPFADEREQDDGDREVSRRDQGIGNYVKPHEPWLPQIAVAMRLEITGAE